MNVKKKARGRVRKLLAVMMSAMLVLSLTAISAFGDPNDEDNGSASTTATTGTITIDNAVVGQTYTVYQVLDLESYHVDNQTTGAGQYAYKATSAWNNFINSEAIKDVYVNVDAQGYVTWITNADTVQFAKLAQAYAKKNNISNQGSKLATAPEGSTDTISTVEFINLDLGYYLVDSTLGTLCSLDTTNPNVTIKEKNEAPSNNKKVEEDSKTGTDGAWEGENDADIGQTVNFQSTITAQAGAENYVFHDKMDLGLTYGSVTGITLNGTAVDASNYEVKTQAADLESTDPCTFHVVFTQTFCDTLKANDKIVISYTATVNENAVVGSAGNKNESWLQYGENNDLTTTPSETITRTWDVDVFKYTVSGEDDDGNPIKVALSDATFTLSKDLNGSNPIALLPLASQNDESDGESDGEGDSSVSPSPLTYRVAKTGETDTVTEITTNATGKFTIEGLDSDTYYLTETAAPAGYNKLAKPIKISISDTGTVTVYNDNGNGTEVQTVGVENQSGNELPSTGGMGTTILYVVGGILVVGAGVALYVRRRMKAGEQA